MNRRAFLLLAAGLLSATLAAQSQPAGSPLPTGALKPDDLRVISGTALESQYQEMVSQYLLAQIDAVTAQRQTRRDAIHSAADLQPWQDHIRGAFLASIGGLPDVKTPLQPRLTGELQRDGYVVRKLIFESQPELYVTANLYVPTTSKGPFPAVLAANGHSTNGKAYANYQHVYIGLVRQGYVVLTWDNIGQGERYQLWDFIGDHSRGRDNGNEHGMIGIPEYLLGQSLAREMIWDGIRALDYLASLPEVDPTRIGMTGNSGGGTLTTYISMLDPRIKAASIVTYITSFRKKVEARTDDSESDPEQDLFGPLAAGVDHTELVGLIAPRPVLIGAALRDFFPIAGTRATFAELQGLYARAGAPERIDMVAFDHEHMYSQPLREATTAWFNRWLKGENGAVHEPPITVEDDRTLNCTPTGQVATSLGGQTLAGLQRAELRRLEADLTARRRSSEFKPTLAARIRRQLVLAAAPPEPSARPAGQAEAGDLVIEKLLVEPEPGIVLPLRIVKAKQAAGRLRSVLYLRDRDGSGDDPALYEALARAGRLVAVADVRGFGETKSPLNVRDRKLPYYHARGGTDADQTYAAFLLGRPMLGLRVGDALAVLHVLRARPDVLPEQVIVAGRGWAGLIAAFAGAVDGQTAGVAAEGAPVSYAGALRTDNYALPVSQLLPGVLKEFDLQDVYGSLAPKPLLLLNPVNAETRKMDHGAARTALAGVRAAYEQAGRQFPAPALSIDVAPFEADALARLQQWILER
jgi:cephalosporin-C deacetylase-like acetyl esterase